MTTTEVVKFAKYLSEETAFSFEELLSKRRLREIVETRQIIMSYMYQKRHIYGITHKQISQIFNQKHSTCVYACKVIKNLCENNNSIKIEFEKMSGHGEKYLLIFLEEKEAQRRAIENINEKINTVVEEAPQRMCKYSL